MTAQTTPKPSFFKRHKKYLILLIILTISIALHVLTRLFVPFANFLNFGPSSLIRAILAGITSIIPFSLGETVVLILPFILLASFVASLFSEKLQSKLTFRLCTLIVALYSLFVISFAPAYATSYAYELFDINIRKLTAEELYESSSILTNEINLITDDLFFDYGSFSRMGYDYDTLTKKLLNSYDRLSEKYDFVKNFRSRLKPIALSEPMIYTHISGVYTYYTGESNINTGFPDYTLPFTCAHEMAHQRGFARENEANFVAFLVCMESDDPYIKYSGYMNMLEYIISPLYSESPDMYIDAVSKLDIRAQCDMAAYSQFFEQYKDSTASTVTSAINDTYLKSQGVEGGQKSYGMVVDLSVAYILDNL